MFLKVLPQALELSESDHYFNDADAISEALMNRKVNKATKLFKDHYSSALSGIIVPRAVLCQLVPQLGAHFFPVCRDKCCAMSMNLLILLFGVVVLLLYFLFFGHFLNITRLFHFPFIFIFSYFSHCINCLRNSDSLRAQHGDHSYLLQ